MLKWILTAIKWWAIGLATGQIISWYKKEKTFRSEFDNAEWFDKLRVAWKYLFNTNKKLIEETNLDAIVDSVKTTGAQAQKQVKAIKPEEMIEKANQVKDQVVEKAEQTIEKVKTQAKQSRDDIVAMLQSKLAIIEDELTSFESNAESYAEDTRTEYYRQLASKFALFKKTVAKYVLEWALAAEEQFELESKLKYLTEKLEELKSGK